MSPVGIRFGSDDHLHPSRAVGTPPHCYEPKQVKIEGVFGKEPLRATVINDKGKVELIEIEAVKGKTGTYDEIRYKKVKQFREPICKLTGYIATKVELELNETGDIVKATYKDMKRVADVTKDIKLTKAVIKADE